MGNNNMNGKAAKSMTEHFSLGHKVVAVAMSAVMLGFGWPAVSPASSFAEGEAAQTQAAASEEATGSSDASASTEKASQTEAQKAESTSTESSASNADKKDDSPASSKAAGDSSSASSDSSSAATDSSSSAASAESKATEADVALSLGNAYITYSKQDISLPATKVTVPIGKNFEFTATANEGYQLVAVYLTVNNGEKHQIDPNQSGVFTVAAADVVAGAAIELETKKLSESTASAQSTVIGADTVIESEAATVSEEGESVSSTLTITGPDSVEQFSSADLVATLDPAVEGGTYSWSSSNENVLTVDANGQVAGVSQGSATVTATWTSADGATVLTATHDVTVVHTTKGTTTFTYYYLNNPEASLDSLKGYWYQLGNGTVDLTGVSAADFPRDNGATKRYDASDRVVTWPDGSTGTTFSVARGSEHWNNILKQYKEIIKQKLPGVEVTDSDIVSITLVPYKLTNNGDGYHVDCSVLFECKGLYTVRYYVDDPTSSDSTGFALIASSATVREGDATNITDFISDFATKYPQTKTVDGVEYTLSPWCTDSAMTHSVNLPYTVSTSNVDFYARYVAGRQVIYNLDGGAWATSAATTYKVDEGQSYTVLSEPTREGYDFAGWQVEGLDGKTTVASGESFTMPDNNVTITATWTKKAASVTVNYLWGDEDSSELIESVSASGDYHVGDVFTVDEKTFDGYTIKPLKSDKVVLKAGENVVNVYYYKNVKLTANSKTEEYDGTEKSVTGFSASVEGVTVDGVSTTGGKGTDAGTYTHSFANGTVGKSDTTNKYYVSEVENGKLIITRSTKAVKIKVVGNTNSTKYDGTEQNATGYSVSGLPTGITESDIRLSGTAEATGTNAGTYDMGLDASKFTYTGKNYEPGKVTFEVTDGWLKIAKRDVVLTSATDQKDYDGTPLTSNNVEVSGDGFANGQGATYNVTGTQTAVGSSSNSFSYSLNAGTDSGNYNITAKEGKLTVNDRAQKYEVTVKANSSTGIYNGSEQSVSGVSGTKFTNDRGVTFTITGLNASAKGTDAGEYASKVTGTVKVLDPDGNDVTKQFKVNKEDGKLTISPKAATITAGSASKEYDGSALTTDEFTTEGFIEGQGIASATIEGSQTVVGSTQSMVKENSWKAQDGTKLSNYTISTKNGTLTVTDRSAKYEIVLEGVEQTKVYNGSDQTMSGIVADRLTFDGVEYTVKNYKSDVTGKDAEEYTQTITSSNEDGSWTVVDPNGNDVSAQFSVTAKSGKLTISPKDVTITSGSAEKTYDGTALTEESAKVTAGDFADGEEAGVSYTYSGSQTNAGSSKNTFEVVFDGTTAKASNYNVAKVPGDLTVNAVTGKVIVTITEHGGSYTYDGVEHSATGYDVKSDNTLYNAKDFTFSGTDSVSGTNAGTYNMELKAGDFQNANPNFTNVEFVIEDNTLTIAKRAVELTSATDSKVYDGTALTNKSVTITSGSFVNGQSFTAEATGSVTNVSEGVVDNGFTYTLTGGATEGEGGNYVITKKTGTLSITPVTSKVTVTITGNNTTATYDGTEKSASGYKASISNELYKASDFTYTGSSEVKATNAGTYAMGLTDGTFQNQSANFTNVEFVVTDGELAIAKREVTLKSADLTKPYDGTALTNGETALATETGWAEGEGATYTFTGSQTLVGSSDNAFSYTLNEGTNKDNYNIAKTEGSLTVTSREAKYAITVVANSTTVTYDGKEHEANGAQTYEFTVDGQTYTVSGLVTENPKATNAGTYTNNISGTPVVKDANGNDVSSEFAVTTQNGTLTIEKAAATLKSASASKTYDGTELTKHEMETVSGFAEGEGVDITYTGTITNAGSSANTYTYQAKAGTNLANYKEITPEYGTLTVTPVTDKVTVTITENSDSKVYNGQEQQVEGYTSTSSNKLYTESCFSFVGAADHKVAKGTNVGTYDMNLAASDFQNVSANFSNVEFKIVDGQLEITPAEIDGQSVVWNKTDVVKTYDGNTYTAGTATATDKYGNALTVEYSVDGKTWYADPSQITALNHGDSKKIQLRATSDNYKQGSYATESENLTINKRSLTFASAGDSKVYDGTPLTRNQQSDVTVGLDGFVAGEGATFDITGSQTNVGSSDNAFTYEFNEGTLAENYQVVSSTAGKLIVTADENEVVVTIKGNSQTLTYDGAGHTVQGYSVAIAGGNGNFTADDVALNEGVDLSVSGTDVAVNSEGSVVAYTKAINASDFKSTNPNFSNVTFVVDSAASNVSLTITKRDVVLGSESGEWPYDGQAHSKPEASSSDELFLGQVSDFKATGTVTTVAEGEVANTIAYTPGELFKETNYNVTKSEGALRITPGNIDESQVVWTKSDVVKTYDGQTYTAGVATAKDAYGNELTVEYSIDGKTWVSDPSELKAKDVADSKTIQLRATNGNYSNYANNAEALTITPANAVVNTDSASKYYDGEPLTAGGSITLVAGETATVVTSDSQTDVGTKPNRAYKVDWNGTAKAGNYSIVDGTFGTLEVKAQSIVPDPENPDSYKDIQVSSPEDKTYDGAEHKWSPVVTDADGNALVEGTDYEVSYSTGNFTDATGTITVTITGKGNYAGTVTKTYQITPKGYTVVTDSDSRVYNGTELKAPGRIDGIVAGEDAGFQVTGSQTDAGTSENTYVVNWNGNAKQSNYRLEGESLGTLEVTRAAVTVAANDATKVYGETDPGFTAEVFGLVPGEPASLIAYSVARTGSDEAVGTYPNVIVPTGSEVQGNYTVTFVPANFQITKSGELTVIGHNYNMPYDGQEHGSAAEPSVTEGTTVEYSTDGGKTWSAEVPVVKDVADVTVTVRATNPNYSDAETTYTLKVSRRAYTVSTDTETKVYDGAPLTAHGSIVGIVEGEDAGFEVTGSQTEVGRSDNTYVVKWNGTAKQSNYELKGETVGTLTVAPQSIDPGVDPENPDPAYKGVEVSSPEDKTYDGAEHKWSPVVTDADGNALVEGTDYEVSYSTGNFTDATGTITVTITGKGNYAGTVTKTYQINPATAVVNTDSASKYYDGEPLTAGGSITLVAGETATVVTSDSQTDVGTKPNRAYKVDWNGTAKAGNYSIVDGTFGTLEVKAQSIVPDPENPDSYKGVEVGMVPDVVYNGKTQEQKPTVTDKDGNVLVEGKDYVITFTEDTVNTGTVTVTITGKGNYTGETTRTYQITPKGYSVATESATKVYDGTALTAPGKVTGLVNDADATFTVTGSQTNAGSSSNAYTIEFSSEQMAKNYTLTGEEIGTLVVTASGEMAVTGTSYEGVYDGAEHGTAAVPNVTEGTTVEYSTDGGKTWSAEVPVVKGVADVAVMVRATNSNYKDATCEYTLKVNPAPLSIVTSSATKVYDGSALTSTDMSITGLVKGETLIARTTGTQTEVGSSANTYVLAGGSADLANYVVTETLGTLTVEAAVVPAPNNNTVVPGGTTGNVPAANTVARALADTFTAVTGEEAAAAPEEQIYDNENPLGTEAHSCWVHFYMIICMILTALYGLFVVFRRGNHTHQLKKDMNDVMGDGGDDGKEPVATTKPAGTEA